MTKLSPRPATSGRLFDGIVHYRIGDAAKLLGTNAKKVKELMGAGELDWRQYRANSKVLWISGTSIAHFKTKSATKQLKLL